MSTPTARARVARATLMAVALAAACEGNPYREVNVDLGAADLERPADPGETRRPRPLRFSVAAMQSPRNTYSAYARLFERVSQLLGVDIEFVQRRSYREVNDLLTGGELDAAFVCTGGQLELAARAPEAVEILAVPVVGGRTEYHSLIIVPAGGPARSIGDLAGRRFAYTDELSLSGRAYPVHLLRTMGLESSSFFGATVYTRSHDRSIQAVEGGVVDGAAVDSLIYDYLLAQDRERAGRTTVIHRSPPLGMMPIVASTRLPAELRARLRAVLLALHDDEQAARQLRIMHIERFALPAPDLYREAAAIFAGAQ